LCRPEQSGKSVQNSIELQAKRERRAVKRGEDIREGVKEPTGGLDRTTENYAFNYEGYHPVSDRREAENRKAETTQSTSGGRMGILGGRRAKSFNYHD